MVNCILYLVKSLVCFVGNRKDKKYVIGCIDHSIMDVYGHSKYACLECIFLFFL